MLYTLSPNKLLVLLLSSFVLLLSGCGNAENSELAKRHQVGLDLDSKNYDGVIRSLGDCSQFSNEDRQRCLLDLGSAYMAKGGFSVLSLGQNFLQLDIDKVSDEQFSKDVTKLLVERLDSPLIVRGIEVIEKLFSEADSDLNSRLCTRDTYENYGRYVAQGCLTSNPLLLKDILSKRVGGTLAQKNSTTAVSLKDIINYKNAISDATPEASRDEVISIINKERPKNSKDRNGNRVNDSLDATICTLDAYKSGSFRASDCKTSGTVIVEHSTNAFSQSQKATLQNIFSVGVIVGDSSSVYRLAQKSANSTQIITVLTSGFCRADGLTMCEASAVDGKSCLVCPSLKIDSTKTQTLEDSIDTTLNDDDSFKALALTLEAGDDDKTDAEKVKNLREDICGGPTLSKCPDRNPDGSVKIPTKVALEYFRDRN